MPILHASNQVGLLFVKLQDTYKCREIEDCYYIVHESRIVIEFGIPALNSTGVSYAGRRNSVFINIYSVVFWVVTFQNNAKCQFIYS